ncbi:hypothetical protein EVA_04990, partial [gut metagenome]
MLESIQFRFVWCYNTVFINRSNIACISDWKSNTDSGYYQSYLRQYLDPMFG